MIRRLDRDERGLGLPELLVAISLLAILSTLLVTLIVTFTRTMTREESATDSTNVASSGMKETARVIRAGTEIPVSTTTVNDPVFIYADADHATLYAYLDTSAASPQPLKVDLQVGATSRELVETRWTSTRVGTTRYWTFSSTPLWSRSIARKIVLPDSTSTPLHPLGVPHIFTYYTAAGGVIPIPVSGGLTEAARRTIAAVQVTLVVQADPTNRAAPVTIQNTVGIPNLGISRVGP